MHINAHEIEPEDSCTSEHFSYKSEPRLHVVVEEPNWFIPADFFELSKLHGLVDHFVGQVGTSGTGTSSILGTNY